MTKKAFHLLIIKKIKEYRWSKTSTIGILLFIFYEVSFIFIKIIDIITKCINKNAFM